MSHGRRTSVVVRAGLTVKDLKPTGNRVLVLPDAPETKTAGGILLSTSETNSGPGSSICGMEGKGSAGDNPLRLEIRSEASIYGERNKPTAALETPTATHPDPKLRTLNPICPFPFTPPHAP